MHEHAKDLHDRGREAVVCDGFDEPFYDKHGVEVVFHAIDPTLAVGLTRRRATRPPKAHQEALPHESSPVFKGLNQSAMGR